MSGAIYKHALDVFYYTCWKHAGATVRAVLHGNERTEGAQRRRSTPYHEWAGLGEGR